MKNQFSRTALIYGAEAIEKLNSCRVAVFGIGGVGGHTVEALVRSGVGAIDIVDNDVVSITNINRQIVALHSTIGKSKVEVMADRIMDINPDCKVTQHQCFFLPETADDFDFNSYDYVVDAVDTVKAKLALAKICYDKNIPIISSMGAGNKTDPTRFEIADINKTSYDPLAKVIRKELKAMGVKKLKVVYSKEQPIKPPIEKVQSLLSEEDLAKRTIPGSNAFVPSVAGLVIASEVIKDLVCQDN